MTRSTTLRFRSVWFQVHKWLGLALFLILIPLSLSGSLLVWDGPLDRMTSPQRYAVSDTRATLPVTAYLAAARAVLAPTDRLASIALPDDAGAPVVVAAAPAAVPGRQARPGPPVRQQVWLDPATARVVDHGNSNSGLARTLHMFHGTLLIPGVGRTIVGVLGIAMLLSALTGIWLWWPLSGSLRRGFRWKRNRETSSNLHYTVGIWIAVPLALLSFTGVYISFPGLFGGGPPAMARPGNPGAAGGRPAIDPRRAPPLATTAMTPAAAVAAAGAGDLRMLRWPTEASAMWTATLATPAGIRQVAVDDATGIATPAPAMGGSGFARLMRGLHDGHDYNPVWQTIIFLGGIAPAVLGITGLLMWLRTRIWRGRAADTARRRRATAN